MLVVMSPPSPSRYRVGLELVPTVVPDVNCSKMDVWDARVHEEDGIVEDKDEVIVS